MSNMSNNNITDGTTEFRVIDKRLFSILDLLYPVGRIIISNDSTAPFSDIGFGTWQEVAKCALIEGADDSHAAGNTIEAGLPNITGMAHIRPSNNNQSMVWNEQNGAIQTKIVSNPNDRSRSMASTTNEMIPFSEINIDASRCSSVYGKSNTVQPKAYVSHYWLRVK